jgi:hypothetical protein
LNTQKHVIKVPQIDVPFICNKDHIGWFRLWINIQCGIRDISIMAMSYPASNLNNFFSISINFNMPYKIKLIMSNVTRCYNAQLARWWHNRHLMWVLHIVSKSMVDI